MSQAYRFLVLIVVVTLLFSAVGPLLVDPNEVTPRQTSTPAATSAATPGASPEAAPAQSIAASAVPEEPAPAGTGSARPFLVVVLAVVFLTGLAVYLNNRAAPAS